MANDGRDENKNRPTTTNTTVAAAAAAAAAAAEAPPKAARDRATERETENKKRYTAIDNEGRSLQNRRDRRGR